MRLLASIRAGDAVIVSKIDRFGRDMVFIVNECARQGSPGEAGRMAATART
jgi:DNA invertase Pin-like site-specific DNA recombinase